MYNDVYYKIYRVMLYNYVISCFNNLKNFHIKLIKCNCKV